jgi:hypothetical protein
MSQPQIFNAVCVRDPNTGALVAFDTRAEADMFLRKPLITSALLALGAAQDLVDWLIDNTDSVLNAFGTDTIRRVTKNEKASLKTALDVIATLKDKRFDFLTTNAEAIVTSFKWPATKKMSPEESALATKNTLMAALDNNVDVVSWIIANKDAVLKAFEAGVIKREVDPKAKAGLKIYQLANALEKILAGNTFETEEALENAVAAAIADKTIERLYDLETGEAKHEFDTYLSDAMVKLKDTFLPDEFEEETAEEDDSAE